MIGGVVHVTTVTPRSVSLLMTVLDARELREDDVDARLGVLGEHDTAVDDGGWPACSKTVMRSIPPPSSGVTPSARDATAGGLYRKRLCRTFGGRTVPV
jgi:hypothetical protein